jgi:hypothetical protein
MKFGFAFWNGKTFQYFPCEKQIKNGLSPKLPFEWDVTCVFFAYQNNDQNRKK